MIYLNDFEPFVASGLQAMHPEAVVDTTSIVHQNHQAGTLIPPGVKPVHHDFSRYEQCHFFAGIGGWPTAMELAGWPAGRPVWTGSCPCQPYSTAGKRQGQKDERDLWPDFFRQIERFRPAEVFGEQVASPDGLTWLTGVRTDLEAAGYFFWAVDLAAAGVGAPIIRQRLFWGARRRDLPGSSGERNCGIGDLHSPIGHGRGSRRTDDSGHERIVSVSTGSDVCVWCRKRTASLSIVRGQFGQQQDTRVCRTCYDAMEHHWSESMGGSCGSGLQGHCGNGTECHESGRFSEDTRRSASTSGGHGDSSDKLGQPDGAGPTELGILRRRLGEADWSGQEGHWDQYTLCYFRDERHPGQYKARRIEPGLEPLAHGIPAGHAELLPRLLELGLDSATAKRCITLARTHRVGTIRGYGNAIVPQAAAKFLRAWLDVFP